MLVGIDRVIATVDKRDAKIDKRIAGYRTALCSLDDPFFHGRSEVLRDRTAEDLVYPFETGSAIEWFKDALAIPELPASAGLLLVPALYLDLLGDRFLVRHLGRMQRDLDVISIVQFRDDRFNVKLARAWEDKLLCLRVPVEMKRRVFFEYLVQRHRDLLFVCTRLRFDGEGNRRFRILDLRIDDRLRFFAERIAG